jgi:hypothetical protein
MFISDGRTQFVTVQIMLHICQDRRGYRVTWSGRPQDVTSRVIAFLDARKSTHAWDVLELPAGLDTLTEWLYPLCEHGMSLDLCAGPQHYPYDDEEAAYYGL